MSDRSRHPAAHPAGPVRAARRASLLIGLPALLLGATACGDDDTRRPADPPIPRSAPGPPVGVLIGSPTSGAVAPLVHTDGRSVLPLRGTAPPSTRVMVVVGCARTPCTAGARADLGGTWTVRVPVRLTPGQRTLSVSAEPDDAGSTEPANVIVLQVDAADARRAAAADADGDARDPDGAARPRTPRGGDGSRATDRSPRPAAPPVATAPAAPPAPAPGPAPSATAPDGGARVRGTVHAIGDSLIEGIGPLLPALLPRATVTVDERRGRPLAVGVRLLLALPRGSTAAVSLFTNDDPRRVDALESGVRRVLDHLGPDGCVVWATFVRPPVDGVSYDAASTRLSSLAARSGGRLRVVPWARLIARRPQLLSSDGVHATPAGYRELARLYADELARCPG